MKSRKEWCILNAEVDNMENKNTIKFTVPKDARTAQDVLLTVYAAMREKGYDPVNQIVGYLLSGDPTYITSYNNARSLVCLLERDEILEEIVRFYVAKNFDS